MSAPAQQQGMGQAPSVSGREVLGFGKDSISRLGGMVGLMARAFAALITPPFDWRRETLIQAIVQLKITAIPVLIVGFFFGGGALAVLGGDALSQLGALDRTGGLAAPGLLREFGVFLTGSLLAGVTGTAITAELGSRIIREEVAALEVLGVDTIRYLVLPRLISLPLVAVLLLMLGFVTGCFGALVISTLPFPFGHGGPPGAFLTQMLSNTSFLDLYGAVGKALLFGVMVAVIACYKGLNVSGGAEGVGQAVNESVVAGLAGVFFLSLVYTYLFLGFFPEATVAR